MVDKQTIEKYILCEENFDLFGNKNIKYAPIEFVNRVMLDAYIGEAFSEESFKIVLFRYMKETNTSTSDIYSRVNIDRRLFYKIRNDKNYHPSKDTVILLGIALRLDYEDLDVLLATASYVLSRSNRRDLIIKYFFVHHIHDINLINESLYDYDFKTLN